MALFTGPRGGGQRPARPDRPSRRRSGAAVVGVAALALALPPIASGSTYCAGASGPDCTGGVYPGTGDGLQAAIDAADLNADISGALDTVRIGPGTYLRTSGAGFSATSDLTIEGAGDQTVLTTDATPGRTVLQAPVAAGATARRLRVEIVFAAIGIDGFLRVSDVRVAGPGVAGPGIRMAPGGRLSRAVIEPRAITSAAVNAFGGVVEDVLVRLRSEVATPVHGVAAGAVPPAPGTTTVRHLTVVGNAAPLTTGVLAQAIGSAAGPITVAVAVRDSVLTGLDIPLRRFAATTSAANPGTASIEYRHSALDLTPGESLESGPGALTAGPGNLDDPDPLLGPDLEPLAGSPLVNAGDPAGPEAGDSPTDALGRPRIVGAGRDIGALERQALPAAAPPVTAAPVPPLLSRLRIAPSAFARAGGAVVSFTLDAAASVRFAVARVLPGRRVGRGRGRRCAPRTRVNAQRPRCTRLVARGGFARAGVAGPNRFRFGGVALRPGRYRLTATPTSAAGLRGRPASAAFRILAQRKRSR